MSGARRFEHLHVVLCALVTICLVVGACGSPSSAAKPVEKQGDLQVGVFAPFSGPDAFFGTLITSGCFPAAYLINKAGGVLGHQVKCISSDSRGDPADAVPAIRQMLASNPNLVAMEGLTSDEASATVPLVEKAKLVLFDGSGLAQYDHNTNPYFWRMYPADDTAGYAMALVAAHNGYKRAAAIFGNDTGSQGTVSTVTSGFKKLGGSIVVSEAIALDQSSYRSEIETMWAAKPDVIFTELDAQTAAVFFSELKQLHNMLPIVGADPTLDPTWFKAVAGAIGAADVNKYYSGEFPATTTSGPAWDIYSQAVLATPGEPNPKDSTTASYTEEFYDSTNIVALAMLAAKTTDPTFFNPYIRKITQSSPGAVVVNSFADGKAALLAGKTIQYAGVIGPLDFNQWQNAVGGFDIDGYAMDGTITTVGHLTNQDILQVQS